MATKALITPEKFYECEVKRRRVRTTGPGYEPFWKLKTLADALLDGDTEFRCKDCHGPLKLHRRHTPGTPSYLEHKLKVDSEHCQQGARFLEAADGRAHRQSATPVA
ncbi:hypothetical protein GOB94_10460 [Granulicella sp. 5B5]|uniref:hypothetical protein n=1 Tax=Granulicella sp. 5B5 TaxID=1617967 RepID=UPI0015F59EB9|nr:hypothetical protein [Granulicella sp. 5B5]QMV19051.1 hypothetical protein GOB94_10460 [Granulicella sp. 5B5]